MRNKSLGGGFKYFSFRLQIASAGRPMWVCAGHIFYFHPDPWGNDPIWRAYFSNGWLNNQLDQDFLSKDDDQWPVTRLFPCSCLATLAGWQCHEPSREDSSRSTYERCLSFWSCLKHPLVLMCWYLRLENIYIYIYIFIYHPTFRYFIKTWIFFSVSQRVFSGLCRISSVSEFGFQHYSCRLQALLCHVPCSRMMWATCQMEQLWIEQEMPWIIQMLGTKNLAVWQVRQDCSHLTDRGKSWRWISETTHRQRSVVCLQILRQRCPHRPMLLTWDTLWMGHRWMVLVIMQCADVSAGHKRTCIECSW